MEPKKKFLTLDNLKIVFSLSLLVGLTTGSVFAQRNKSDPILAEQDLTTLGGWEQILESAQAGNVPWYRSKQSFVSISYKEENLSSAHSNFLSCLKNTLVSTEPEIVRDSCYYFVGCRLEVYKEHIPQVLKIMRHYREQMSTWDYTGSYICGSFRRGSQEFIQELKKGDEVTTVDHDSGIVRSFYDNKIIVEINNAHQPTYSFNKVFKKIWCLKNVCVGDRVAVNDAFVEIHENGMLRKTSEQFTGVVMEVFPDGLVDVLVEKRLSRLNVSELARIKKCSEIPGKNCRH